jgi:glucose/arabinose dehydrogenase
MKKLLLLLSLFLCVFLKAQTIETQSYITGITNATDIAHCGDSRLFAVQQNGIIKIINANGTVNTTPFLTLTTATIVSGGERGLLGLAFHPNYTDNGYFYLNYTRAGDGATVIARYSVSDTDPNVANPNSALILMTINQPYTNHNGGNLEFGPDGYLYIGMGDGGSGGDPQNYAQNLTIDTNNPSRVYLGKMLRIDVNSTSGNLNYSIPPSNPYASTPGLGEIWAIGVRNPWKFSFNRLNGDLWISDVGQNAIEEINKVTNPLANGLNFGWRCYEGNSNYNVGASCPALNTTAQPFAQYTQTNGRCSITGGYFYSGSTYPNFQNKYVFADYCTSEIGVVNASGAITWYPTSIGGFGITCFGEDSDGELYVAANNTDRIYKVVDTSLSTTDFENNGFTIAPNPAKDFLTLTANNQNTLDTVVVYDISGKQLIAERFSNLSQVTINVSSLAKGLYIVVAQNQKGNQMKSKFVVE